MKKVYTIIAVIQAILHYLAILGIIAGGIVLIFGNIGKGWELIIGGASLFILKYVIGIVFIFILMRTNKKSE